MSICSSLSLCLKQSKPIANNIKWISQKSLLYSIEEKTKKNKRGALYQKCKFKYFKSENNHFYPWIKIECFQLKKIKSQTNIVLIYIINSNSYSNDNPNKSTIIYSHSNKGDLGTHLPFLIDLSTQLKRSTIAYDYTGYGWSDGEASIKHVYSDIDQVMDFCINNLHIVKQNIVLIGHSTGAIPSIYIASQGDYCSIRGIVLLSPFITDDHLSNGDNNIEKDNIINYFDLATEVLCPVFIMHGRQDTTVSVKQSELLKEKLRCSSTWFPDNGRHFNYFYDLRRKSYKKLRKFINTLEENNTELFTHLTSYKLNNILNLSE